MPWHRCRRCRRLRGPSDYNSSCSLPALQVTSIPHLRTLVRERAGALVVGTGALLTNQRKQIIALATRQALPTIYPFREFAVDGGLISYGNNVPDTFRQGGVYAGRILKGDKPADLPVILSTKFEFVLNLKTAKALGLTVSPTLLARVDEVIE